MHIPFVVTNMCRWTILRVELNATRKLFVSMQRHYNAWYGLGMIDLRQEKFDFAEHHFRMAFQINPRSSAIMSYLGTALHALKRSAEGLVMMEKAILADKKNPLPMFQKASILVSLEKFDKALEVLLELKYCPSLKQCLCLDG